MNRTLDRLVTSGFKGLAGEATSQVGLVAASSWPLQDTEISARNGQWVMDQMVEITDGPPVFVCVPFLLRFLKGSSKWP